MSEIPEAVQWILIVVLVAMSGLFSGLNLGLMGLEPMDLQIVQEGAEEPNKSYARKIKPLRDRGNWLLCTLLLGNVAVNAGLSILLADITGGTLGFVVSTALIVLFGEIIPQALCSRHALMIGAWTVHVVWVLMALMAVIAYPISVVLDWILGSELGTIYSNKELQKLVQIHAEHEGTGVSQRAADVLRGAMGLHDKCVFDVMTEMDSVFFLTTEHKLTFDVLSEVFKSGHSRIPIVENKANRIGIVGILYVKDLILLDPDDEMPVTRIMEAFGHVLPPCVYTDYTLDQALKVFIKEQQHLAIVKDVKEVEGGEKDNVYEFVGIITLEDVIEHILQAELVDEHDNFADRRHKTKTGRLSRIDWTRLIIFDHRRSRMMNLPPQELQAVYHFLSQSVRVFMPQHRKAGEGAIKNLLQYSRVIRVNVDSADENERKSSTNLLQDSEAKKPSNFVLNKAGKLKRTQRDPYRDVEDNGLLLYQRDKKSDYFTLILDGSCEIYSGKQGFRSELHCWSYLCPDALEHIQMCHEQNKPAIDYVADFTCKVVETSRVLRISLADFKACLEGKFDADRADSFPERTLSAPVGATHLQKTTNAQYSTLDGIHEHASMGDIPISAKAPLAYTYTENDVQSRHLYQPKNHHPDVGLIYPAQLMAHPGRQGQHTQGREPRGDSAPSGGPAAPSSPLPTSAAADESARTPLVATTEPVITVPSQWGLSPMGYHPFHVIAPQGSGTLLHQSSASLDGNYAPPVYMIPSTQMSSSGISQVGLMDPQRQMFYDPNLQPQSARSMERIVYRPAYIQAHPQYAHAQGQSAMETQKSGSLTSEKVEAAQGANLASQESVSQKKESTESSDITEQTGLLSSSDRKEAAHRLQSPQTAMSGRSTSPASANPITEAAENEATPNDVAIDMG